MSQFLVTGGAGFLGSHLAASLTEQSHHVVILDDLSGGARRRVPDGAELIEGDITNPDAVDDAFARLRFDGIFHLAAFAAEGISHAVKRHNYASNVIGSINIINAALRAGTGFIGFASSIAVYGNGRTPMRERHAPQPSDSYGNAKLAVERELAITMRLQGLPFFAFRMHNIYGEWQNMHDPFRNAVAIFLNQIMRGEPLTVYGDGQQVRAFTYVGDVVTAFVAAAQNPDCWGQALNVGSSQPSTLLEVADLVRKAMGVPDHPIQHLPARHEVRAAYTDTRHARRMLGEWPETTLAEGIARTAAWARGHGPVALSTTVEIEVPDNDTAGWIGWINGRLSRE